METAVVMRKLKIQIQVSIDGYIAGINGELDWMITNWDQELKKYVYNLTRPVDCILLGKNLASIFMETWDKRLDDPLLSDALARKINETQKIVFSNTLMNNPWKNTKILKGDFVEEISKLKQTKGKDIIAYGGATMVQSLVRSGLIDEYHLFINPVVLGKGIPLFERMDPLGLKLVYSTSFDCGINIICYMPDKTHMHQKRPVFLSTDTQNG